MSRIMLYNTFVLITIFIGFTFHLEFCFLRRSLLVLFWPREVLPHLVLAVNSYWFGGCPNVLNSYYCDESVAMHATCYEWGEIRVELAQGFLVSLLLWWVGGQGNAL